MERLPVRALDVGGTAGTGKYLDSDGNWTKPTVSIEPDPDGGGIEPGALAQVLTTTGEGATWFGNVVVLIEEGGSIPPGTPAGVIIVEKGSA